LDPQASGGELMEGVKIESAAAPQERRKGRCIFGAFHYILVD